MPTLCNVPMPADDCLALTRLSRNLLRNFLWGAAGAKFRKIYCGELRKKVSQPGLTYSHHFTRCEPRSAHLKSDPHRTDIIQILRRNSSGCDDQFYNTQMTDTECMHEVSLSRCGSGHITHGTRRISAIGMRNAAHTLAILTLRPSTSCPVVCAAAPCMRKCMLLFAMRTAESAPATSARAMPEL